jgi:hypothetical protein
MGTYQRRSISRRCEEGWHAAATRGHSTRALAAWLAEGQKSGVTPAATYTHRLEPRCRAYINAGVSVADVKGGGVRLRRWCGCNEGGLCVASRIPPPASQTKVAGLKNVARSGACNYGHVFCVTIEAGTGGVGQYWKVPNAHVPIWRQYLTSQHQE